MAIRAPSSMVVDYNPQEWGRGGPTGGAYRPHAAVQAQPSRDADPINGTTVLLDSAVLVNHIPQAFPHRRHHTPLRLRRTLHLGHECQQRRFRKARQSTAVQQAA